MIIFFLLLNYSNLFGLKGEKFNRKNVAFLGEDTVTEYSYDEPYVVYEQYQKSTNFDGYPRRRAKKKFKKTHLKNFKNYSENYDKSKKRTLNCNRKFLCIVSFFSVVYLIYIYKASKKSNFMSKNKPLRIV